MSCLSAGGSSPKKDIVRNLLRLRKSLTRNFSIPIRPPVFTRPIFFIHPTTFPIRPDRLCKRATLERSFGPFCNAVWAELSPRAGKKPPLVDWLSKKGNACALPLLVQRYNKNGRNANRCRKKLTCPMMFWLQLSNFAKRMGNMCELSHLFFCDGQSVEIPSE